MKEKTVLILRNDVSQNLKNQIMLIDLDFTNIIDEKNITFNYEDLTAEEKVKFDDVIAILESKLK